MAVITATMSHRRDEGRGEAGAGGGPSADQVVATVRRILATGRVTVLDIACPWHPASQDHVQQGRADLLRQLISEGLR